MKTKPTIERIKNVLEYQPDTGLFFWKVKKANSLSAGDAAGTPDRFGYIMISVDGVRLKAHRVAFAICNGRWPKNIIDHINGVVDDNRICNLREATHSQNLANSGVRKDNALGMRGVRYAKRYKKYEARIQHNGIRYFLGHHDTAEEAYAAYVEKYKEYFGQYAKVNGGGE